MDKSTKTAIAIGGGVVGALVIAGIWEHFAHAAPAVPPCKCYDNSPCPGGDPTKCPPPGTTFGPSNQSNVTYNYTGTIQADVLQRAQALAAVDPCKCANVNLVRAFQYAAGLTVSGQTDGRYGSNTAAALAYYVNNAPAACSTQSWEGAEGTYSNPNCQGDQGPTYTG
ncbi:MAG: peptidoglycan-binding domain-containing protein [Acidiferrobacteraceae bacterium]